MHIDLLSARDKKAIDALIADLGGPQAVGKRIREMRVYETRKKAAAAKGMGKLLDQASST